MMTNETDWIDEDVTTQTLAQKKRALAERYVKLGMHLLIIAPGKKSPINKWREGSVVFDVAELPTEQSERGDYLRNCKASNDLELVNAWLEQWPEAVLAVDGAPSKMFLLDLDLDREEMGPIGFHRCPGEGLLYHADKMHREPVTRLIDEESMVQVRNELAVVLGTTRNDPDERVS